LSKPVLSQAEGGKPPGFDKLSPNGKA